MLHGGGTIADQGEILSTIYSNFFKNLPIQLSPPREFILPPMNVVINLSEAIKPGTIPILHLKKATIN